MTDSNERFLFENVEVAVQKGTKQFMEILAEALRTYETISQIRFAGNWNEFCATY